MDRPCYVYLKLKIPGPKGVITVNGDLDKAAECEKGQSVFAELAVNTEELAQMRQKADPTQVSLTKRPADEAGLTFESAQEIKRIALEEGKDDKTAGIGAHLSPK